MLNIFLNENILHLFSFIVRNEENAITTFNSIQFYSLTHTQATHLYTHLIELWKKSISGHRLSKKQPIRAKNRIMTFSVGNDI